MPQVHGATKDTLDFVEKVVLTEINADKGSMDAYQGGYSTAKAAALRGHQFDRASLGRRGQPYERLDQLVVELLLGVR